MQEGSCANKKYISRKRVGRSFTILTDSDLLTIFHLYAVYLSAYLSLSGIICSLFLLYGYFPIIKHTVVI